MHILALNCGSSSIKAASYAGTPLRRVRNAVAEQVGAEGARLRIDGAQRALRPQDDMAGVVSMLLTEFARDPESGEPLTAIAHRVVHGGEKFTRPTRIDDTVLTALDELSTLAPLHNPPAVAAIRRARDMFPSVPQFAIFDTAFHSTLPRRAREYALPRTLRDQFGIRRFGFHGLSHQRVMQCVAEQLGTAPRELRIISCHLGNGSSITAIEYGRSVETSMGMTPMEGLVMGTRAGDVDTGVMLELMRTHDRDALQHLLMRASGLAGMTGTNDLRVIEQRAEQGDEECRLAIAVYAHRVRKYIGAYAATMGGVDAIAFTGGIGENSALMRHRCLQRLEFLGAHLDEDRNRDALRDPNAVCADIAEDSSRVRLFALRADEALAMAQAIVPLLNPATAQVTTLRVPIAVSARHAHLSQRTLDRLFGFGHQLTPRVQLSQPGQFAAQETITLIGPRGRLERVRILGPVRDQDQIEVSRSDEFVLGVDAPVRMSGDLSNTPGITVEGPHGRITLTSGLIAARRHIHMSIEDGARFNVHDGQVVSVKLDSADRQLVFDDVTVRIHPNFRLELHLDTDEANAALVAAGDQAELIVSGHTQSRTSGMS